MYYTEKEATKRNYKTFDDLLNKCHNGNLADMMKWICSSDLSNQFSNDYGQYLKNLVARNKKIKS